SQSDRIGMDAVAIPAAWSRSSNGEPPTPTTSGSRPCERSDVASRNTWRWPPRQLRPASMCSDRSVTIYRSLLTDHSGECAEDIAVPGLLGADEVFRVPLHSDAPPR